MNVRPSLEDLLNYRYLFLEFIIDVIINSLIQSSDYFEYHNIADFTMYVSLTKCEIRMKEFKLLKASALFKKTLKPKTTV